MLKIPESLDLSLDIVNHEMSRQERLDYLLNVANWVAGISNAEKKDCFSNKYYYKVINGAFQKKYRLVQEYYGFYLDRKSRSASQMISYMKIFCLAMLMQHEWHRSFVYHILDISEK